MFHFSPLPLPMGEGTAFPALNAREPGWKPTGFGGRGWISVGMVSDRPKDGMMIAVDRSSPLGNVFEMVDEGCREAVCENFGKLIRAPPSTSREQVLTLARESGTRGRVRMWEGKKALAYLRQIENVAKHMPIVLGCHCKGKGRCHAETIKSHLEMRLQI